MESNINFEDFKKQLLRSDLETIQELKKTCMRRMERRKKETYTKYNGIFYFMYELYGILWRRENELLNQECNKKEEQKHMSKKNIDIANYDLRLAIFQKQVYHKDLAKKLGITECHLSHLLAEELPEKRKDEILEVLKTM